MVQSLPLLLPLLDREAYVLRTAIVQSIGFLIDKAREPDSEENSSASNNRGYQNVVNRRSSVVIRRQSIVQSAEKEKDEESSVKLPSCRFIDLKTAIPLIKLLTDRTCDMNAFVRAASLRTLTSLSSKSLIPLSEVNSVTTKAVARICDKAVLVRKNALGVRFVILLHDSA